MIELNIFTDGGCRNNPGLGAWCYCVQHDSGDAWIHRSEVNPSTTNNEMELTAIYEALSWVKDYALGFVPPIRVNLHSDSQYCINSITIWMKNWIKQNSMEGRPNQDLLLKIFDLINDPEFQDLIELKFFKLKGHSGVLGNELADKYLNQAMDRFLLYE